MVPAPNAITSPKRGIECFGSPIVKRCDALWQGPVRTLVVVEASHEQRNHEAFVVGCVGRFPQMPMSDPDGNGVETGKMSDASGLFS